MENVTKLGENLKAQQASVDENLADIQTLKQDIELVKQAKKQRLQRQTQMADTAELIQELKCDNLNHINGQLHEIKETQELGPLMSIQIREWDCKNNRSGSFSTVITVRAE